VNVDSTRAELRRHWDDRYRTFSLDESGCLGAGPALSRMIYRAKEAALTSALRRAGVDADRSFRVLDMACGFGYFAGFYGDLFPKSSYTGVDISARAIQRAQETATPAAEFFAADVVTWRHPAGRRFDVIQAIDVLQLLMDDASFDAAVANLARHLADDGVLLVPLVCADSAPEVAHHRVRSRAYFDRLIATLGLAVTDELPMYYWLVDGGPTGRVARALFARAGARALYAVDRLALAAGLENRRPQHVLSRARLLTIRHAPLRSSDPRNRASGS
jgi:SAM-dependent methyltransferase